MSLVVPIDGTLSGTTQITLVPGPTIAGRVRLLQTLSVFNKDTGSITFTLYLLNGTLLRTINQVTIAAGARWTLPESYYLDAGTKSFVAALAANPTTNPDFVGTYLEMAA